MPQPRVIIVGGGFGGLAAAKALRSTPAKIILIDRSNHHLFQPLLYQVATSVLMPGQIGTPIRGILRKQKNTTVVLGEVTGVDKVHKCVFVSNADRQNVPVSYDYLILATGVSHSYFGHDEFAQYAPGLKTLADAVAVRNKFLQALEQAEAEEDPSRHRDLMTFILVGAGPTGTEMASALASSNRSFAASIRHPPVLCSWIWRHGFFQLSRRTFRKQPTNVSNNSAWRYAWDTASIKSMRRESWLAESALRARQ
jgi:NADH dehydrogenase FAD-containing subunit